MNVEYTAQIWREGRQYVAHAMPLDVMSSGRTPDEARGALAEAVSLFLATAADLGTLEEVLEEVGYSVGRRRVTGPEWVSWERHTAAVGA
jgi:predicted RNase H-like HicB family nuclease